MPTAQAFSPEEVTQFAQRTAQAVHCVALRWWPQPGQPQFLQIEAQLAASEPPRSVLLRAFLGEPPRES